MPFIQHNNSRNHKLSLESLFKGENNSRILIICLLIILIVIGLLIAYNGRYTTIGESNAPYDKWKKEVIVPSYSEVEESTIQLELKQDLKLDGALLPTGEKSTEWKNLASIYRILKKPQFRRLQNFSVRARYSQLIFRPEPTNTCVFETSRGCLAADNVAF